LVSPTCEIGLISGDSSQLDLAATVEPNMNPNLKALLEHLSATLNAMRQAEVEDLHQRALSWLPVKRLPVVMSYPLPPDAKFKPFPHREVFGDPEKMLYNELAYAFNTSIACRDRIADDLPCTVRADYGTVLMPSKFGAEVEQLEDNPPWVTRPEEGGVSLEAVADGDPTDFTQGWCSRVIETYEFYQATLRAWPKLQPIIKVVLPDLQSPFDSLELIVGCNVFADLRTRSELASRALRNVAVAQVGFARRLARLVNDGPDGFTHQHAMMVRGQILLRDDSTILMSPAMYRDQVAPHDEFVMRKLGSGGIHCCGNVGLHATTFLERDALRSLDFGQSEQNDMDATYRLAAARQIGLVRVAASEEELCSGEILRRFPTGVSLIYRAETFEAAQRVMNGYLRASETS
jgi:hypothetical protein